MPDIGTAFKETLQGTWNDGYQFGDVTNTLFSPLTSVNKWLDIDGSNAAKQQYESQVKLNQDANAFTSAEKQKERDWQTEMSNTAVQRYVKDLEDAGLNKWLAVQNGIGQATTPSSSANSGASGSAAMANNKLAVAAGVIATALRIFFAKH